MKWTEKEIEYLRKEYPERSNADLAVFLHRSPRAVQLKALKLGISKSPEFAEHQRKACMFKKGQVPMNKGRALATWMSPEGIERSSKGRFKRGEIRPDNPNSRANKPVGKERVDKDGYIWVITEHGQQQKHRWVWEQANGPIPRGHCVKFRDGDRTNCSIDNLYLVSRADHVREQLASRTPERHAEIRAKANASRNRSIRRDRLRLSWGLEPEGRLVKRIK